MQLPDRIGRHRVEALVGTGGFALVYRAEDELLEDTVAIKVLAEQWAADADIHRRFLEEARLLRRIGNHNLVTVHDIGELDDGRPYFVMEYANRGTLTDRLKTRGGAGLDVASARMIAATLAGGLGALHKAGVVHRDINPRNLFIKDRIKTDGRGGRAAAPTAIGAGLLSDTEKMVIGDLGLAKNLVLMASQMSVVGGTPGYQAPEQLDPSAEARPATDVFAATSVLWEAINGSKPPAHGDLSAAMSEVDERWRNVFEHGLAADPDDRFHDMDTWLAAVLDALGDESSSTRDTSELIEARRPATNPYQGLAAFQPEDSRRFFGREALVDELVERLSQQRALVVGGASGSGKSSLVRAGLIPAIANGALLESRKWPVALFSPRAQPLEEIAYQLDRVVRSATQRGRRPVSAEELAQNPGTARQAAADATDSAGGLLMVVDQFEEVFTQTSSRDSREAFLDVLAEMVDPVDSRVRLVMVMRADFYAQSARYPWLAERINRNQVLVGPMSSAELRRAIEEPANQAGVPVTPELIDMVLGEAHDDPGALPLVSHALAETWRRRSGGSLSPEAYEETGGVAGAIAQSAEAVYGQFNAEEKKATRSLLLRLVRPGEGSSDTRLALPLTELEAEEAPVGVRRVAEALTEARLLTADEQAITIAHEALIGSWPRLRQWIEDSRDDLRTRQRIEAAAREWDEQGRDRDLLYRGTPLNAALEWAGDHLEALGATARQFLDQSEDAQRRRLEAQAAAEHRRRRARTAAIAILASLLVVAVIASVFAFTSFQEAELRLANQLATQASDLTQEDPRLALALAVEASERGADSFEVREALLNGTHALQDADLAPAGSPLGVGDALTLAVHPDGGYIAVGSRQGGEVILFDLSTGTVMGSPLTGHDDPVVAIAFTPDGHQMLTAGQDGVILRWDVRETSEFGEAESGLVPEEVGRSADVLWDVAVSADGRTIASAGEDGVVQLWDIETMESLGDPLLDSERDVLSVQFSPDGSSLLAGNGRGELMGWDLTVRDPLFEPFNAHGSDIWEIVFSPDGGQVATASSDGHVRVWDLSGNLIAEPFADEASDVRGVQFLGDGRLIAAGDENGGIRVWDVVGGEQVQVTEMAHGEQVIASSITSNGEKLITLGLDHNAISWVGGSGADVELGDHVDGALGVAVSPDGKLVATGDGSGSIRLFSGLTGELRVGPLHLHDSAVWALSFSNDGAAVTSGDESGSMVRIDAATGEILAGPSPVSDSPIRAMATFDGLTLAGTVDGEVRAWDEDLNRAGGTMGPHRGGVTDLAVSDGGTLAVSDRSGTIHFWDPESSTRAGDSLEADDNTIWGVAWSDDGELLAAASDDWAAFVWDFTTRERIATLTSLPEGGAAVGFVDQGRVLATTSRDGSVRLFDVALEREIGAIPRQHRAPAWRLVVFPDGARYVTTSEDGTAVIWDELDLQRACERSDGAFDDEQQRRFLGGAGEAVGCP